MTQDRYTHERGEPAVPQCGRSSVAIPFDGRTLVLRGSRVQYPSPAVSGRPDAGPRGLHRLVKVMNNFVVRLKTLIEAEPNCFVPATVRY